MGKRQYSKSTGSRKTGLTLDKVEFKAESPQPEKLDSKSNDLIINKAFRDLQFSGNIEPHADPNTEITRGSYPYAILNRTNKVTEAKYPGYQNIAGNSIVRLQNSGASQFLNLFDATVMVKRLNYLYAHLDASDTDHTNTIYNIELLKPIEEAVSKGYSTMLTQLAFYADECESSLPRVGQYIGQTNDMYDRMGVLMFYQTVQQNLVTPVSKYVELMSQEQELLNMTYRREASLITQLFGQFKKKAFIAQMESISTAVIGEYFDDNWYRQMNTIRHIPCRKANDMNNPLVTVVSSHFVPNIKLYAGKGAGKVLYFDSDSTGSSSVQGFKYASAELMDPEDFLIKTYTNITLEQVVLNISKLMDPFYILRFCRKLTAGTIDVNLQINTTSGYYEQVNRYIRLIAWFSSRFAANMTEVRTFLDKLNESGMIYWKKGIKFAVNKIEQVEPTYYQVTSDILKNSIAGASYVYYDDNTKRWTCNTEWDMYKGINEYDRMSGGSFFTFALRSISKTYYPAGSSTSQTLTGNDIQMMLPVIFDSNPVTFTASVTLTISGVQVTFPQWSEVSSTGYIPDHVYALTRLGFVARLGHYAITAANFKNNAVFARLNPLSNDSVSVKAPTWNFEQITATTSGQNGRIADNPYNLTATEIARLCSTFTKFILQTAGYGRIKRTNSDYSEVADPDLLCFIDVQLEDISNEMITYARNYSPFRVTTPDGKRTMGFGNK